MAQMKRLTRAQKILLSRIKSGKQPPAQCNPEDLNVLEKRSLIVLDTGGWSASMQRAEELDDA